MKLGVAPGHIARGVLHAGILHSLARDGKLACHAAALVGVSGAILVLGKSGLGKSTLAAAWLHQGPVISDDVVLVTSHPAAPSSFKVEPLRADMYLRTGGNALLPDRARAFAEAVEGERTRLVRGDNPDWFRRCDRVVGIVMLDDGDRRCKTRVRTISQASALAALVASNNYLSAGRDVAPASLFGVALKLASSLPAYRLSVGSDLLISPQTEARRLAGLFAEMFDVAAPTDVLATGSS